MGKGNRSRQDRAFEMTQIDQEPTPKNTKIKTTIATTVIAFLLVACIALSVVVNTGVLLRAQNVAKTDNYSVNGTVMSYLIYSQAQSLAYTYQQYGLNYSVADILAMKYGEGTYFDYFAESSLAQVKQMLLLCEYAKANNITLSDDDKEAIDSYMESIEETAAQNFYSLNSYIKLLYGNGVNASDVRKALELNYLSNAAYEVLEKTLEAKVTDELINKYVEDHKNLFYMVDYLSYTFTAELKAEKTEATVEETQAYEQAKKDMLALAEQLKEIKTADEFETWVIDYTVNNTLSKEFDSLYKSEYESKETDKTKLPTEDELKADKEEMLAALKDYMTKLGNEEEEEEKEEDNKDEKLTDYEKALDKICDKLIESADKAYESLVTEGYYHYDPEAKEIKDLDKWFFNADTKEGDTYLDKSEAKSKSTYTVYILKTPSHKDESETKDVAHILAQFEKSGTTVTEAEKAAAKEEADKILAEYLAGEQTKEAFEKLGNEKTDDSNVIYEGVYEGQMVEEFEDWCFDESRKEGDTGIVETTYGYHVMYFIGDGNVVWYNNAFDGVVADFFEEWLEAEATAKNYSFNQSVIDSIG